MTPMFSRMALVRRLCAHRRDARPTRLGWLRRNDAYDEDFHWLTAIDRHPDADRQDRRRWGFVRFPRGPAGPRHLRPAYRLAARGRYKRRLLGRPASQASRPDPPITTDLRRVTASPTAKPFYDLGDGQRPARRLDSRVDRQTARRSHSPQPEGIRPAQIPPPAAALHGRTIPPDTG